MTYDEALLKIFEGNCLLLLGSGFSCECEIENGGKMPRADGLCKMLDKDADGDLGFAAEEYIEKYGEYSLCELLKTKFTPVSLGEDHKIISAQPWHRVYTTNYDDIVEQGARLAKRRVEGVCLSNNIRDYKNKENLVVHLNGSIHNLTPDTLNNEFKLTRGSYLADNVLESSWSDLLKFDVKDCDAIFIVGLSMDYDLDIARLIYASDTKDKTFIVTWDKENNSAIKKLKRYGTVLSLGRDGFAKDIELMAGEYKAPEKVPEAKYTSFRECVISSERPTINDQAIRNLLILGQVDDTALQFSLFEPHNYTYFIYRNRIDDVVDRIDNGSRDILILGNVGNGKTLFVKGVAMKLRQRGYKVYSFYRRNENTYKELERLCGIKDKKTVLIIEEYTHNKKLLEMLATLRSDIIFITTERTVANDIQSGWLEDTVAKNWFQVNLDRLSDEEIEKAIELLDSVNVWGDLAANNSAKKRKFIENDCKKELRGILLKLLETKPIKDNLKKIFGTLKGDFYDSVVLLLMANYASFSVDIYDLSRAINQDLICNSVFSRDQRVGEFLNFSTGESKSTSPILAEFVLKNFVDPKRLCDILSNTFKKFDCNRNRYANALKSLCRHSTLISLIGSRINEDKDLIADYYDKIKNCRWCTGNPHFWLQYAIAMLDKEDFPAASIYFKNAYSYARESHDFKVIQIDNHYARFLLENAIKNDDDQFWASFVRAHEILTDVRYLKDTKYYPFRVAQNYLPFYERYKRKMDSAKVSKFKMAANQMLEMLEKYLKTTPQDATRMDVASAKRGLEKILADSVIIRL